MYFFIDPLFLPVLDTEDSLFNGGGSNPGLLNAIDWLELSDSSRLSCEMSFLFVFVEFDFSQTPFLQIVVEKGVKLVESSSIWFSFKLCWVNWTVEKFPATIFIKLTDFAQK